MILLSRPTSYLASLIFIALRPCGNIGSSSRTILAIHVYGAQRHDPWCTPELRAPSPSCWTVRPGGRNRDPERRLSPKTANLYALVQQRHTHRRSEQAWVPPSHS